MNDDIKKSQTKKVEQLIIERPIQFHKPSYISFLDDKSISHIIYSSDIWLHVAYKNKTYSLCALLAEGYRVISINKAFIGTTDGNQDSYGVETAILEREI